MVDKNLDENKVTWYGRGRLGNEAVAGGGGRRVRRIVLSSDLILNYIGKHPFYLCFLKFYG